MENIFNSKFREELLNSLKDAGIKESEADKIVNKRYKEAVKAAVIAHLENIITYIEKDRVSDLNKVIGFSPAGDDMGCDNNYIDFTNICGLEDIGDVIRVLNS